MKKLAKGTNIVVMLFFAIVVIWSVYSSIADLVTDPVEAFKELFNTVKRIVFLVIVFGVLGILYAKGEEILKK